MALALVPSVVLLIACALFIFPDILTGSIDWNYSSPTLIALVVALLLIEISILRVNRAPLAEARC